MDAHFAVSFQTNTSSAHAYRKWPGQIRSGRRGAASRLHRTSKFAVTQLVDKADRKTAWEFLQHMLEAVPYQVHTILTDNVLAREQIAV